MSRPAAARDAHGAMNPAAAARALHPTPGLASVLREQLRHVGAALRAELVVAGVVLGGFTLLLLLYGNSNAEFALVDVAVLVVPLGLFAPLAVWRGQEPSRRGYFWALPVARPHHTLARVLGGWGWLMALVGAYVLWTTAATLLAGGELIVGGDWARSVTRGGLPAGEGIVPPAVRPWMWLVPFAAATVTYLLGTIVALASDHPWRWYAGTAFGILVAGQLEGNTEIAWLGRAVRGVLAGRYGLITALTGVPPFGGWVAATGIWLILALAAVLAAAFRHQER